MINEGQVRLLWERIFNGRAVTPECIDQAQKLLEELRPESPLRFRLAQELAEISKLHALP